MRLTETDIAGVFTVDIAPATDDRGMFARTWDMRTAQEHGLIERFDYACVSANDRAGTLRGMHYQRLPHGETKLVRVTRGSAFDVVLDLRPDSPTFRTWHGDVLSATNHRALYIPPGCAHGFLTLEADTEVLYHIAGAYEPSAAAGVRFDDPAFAITWPATPAVIAERDKAYPAFPS